MIFMEEPMKVNEVYRWWISLFIHSKFKRSKTLHLHRSQLIHKSRRGSSVATLDAVRFHDAQGAVSVPYQSSYAQHSHNIFLYLYTPTANRSLVNPAKTVRPREKSFISAISRFQNAAQKKNMNDVRGQKMSEITLLSFFKISKIGFLQFAEKLKGLGKS